MKTMQKDPEKLGHKPLFRVFHVGATDLIRTGDLLITSELLYQLSHTSKIGGWDCTLHRTQGTATPCIVPHFRGFVN